LERLQGGHCWIYSNELVRAPKHLEPGQLVNIKSESGDWVGRGYYNPISTIALRLLTSDRSPIDEAFLDLRIGEAQALRERIFPGEEAYRLIFGEADGLPGLIVDRYGSVLVAQFLTAGMDRLCPALVSLLAARFKPSAILARNDAASRRREGLPQEKKILYGELSSPVVIRKNGLVFEVDVWEGQKTGFFLDQGENYSVLEGRARGARVLDAFCYSGGWGIHALSYGAESVLGLDVSDRAIGLARVNALRNPMQERIDFRQEELFEGLRRRQKASERFDLIVLDPPSFAKERGATRDALRGYKEINRSAMLLLSSGGTLISCSCSHWVDAQSFRKVLAEAARDARRPFRISAWRTQGRDHPIALGIPETQYLQCAILEESTHPPLYQP